MSNRPVDATRRAGVLTLTLDTPGSEVNILSNQAADQILAALDGVRPGNTRAVVFTTAKAESFINGVGLMMAIAARSPESAQALTSRIRAAYDAVSACPVPTVAAIRGNCYGCGIEFSLRCDYRLAADTASTHFYMTELNDYLFNPVFEGTLRLPLLLGLGPAADLLLWGQRWSARQARMRGLVDQVIGLAEFDTELQTFIESTIAGEHRPPPRSEIQAGLTDRDLWVIGDHRTRIHSLPPAYQALYRNCLDLMTRAKEQGRITAEDRQRELILAGTSSSRRKAKNAFSFFFIRQMAGRIAQGDPPPDRRRQVLAFDPHSESLRPLRADLESRSLPDVDVIALEDSGQGGDRPAFYLSEDMSRAPGLHGGGGATPVWVQLARLGRAPAARAPLVLHGPSYPHGRPLFELASPKGSAALARELYLTLTRAGFEVVPTRPLDGFVLDTWLRAYLQPLAAYCLSGGQPADLNASLRRFGFTRRPHALIEDHEDGALGRLLADGADGPADGDLGAALAQLRVAEFESGRFDQRVVDSLLIALLATSLICQENGSLKHPSLVDLIAREALDFPLRYGSLGRFLTPGRIEAVLERADTFAGLLPPNHLARAQAFVERGKRFYL